MLVYVGAVKGQKKHDFQEKSNVIHCRAGLREKARGPVVGSKSRMNSGRGPNCPPPTPPMFPYACKWAKSFSQSTSSFAVKTSKRIHPWCSLPPCQFMVLSSKAIQSGSACWCGGFPHTHTHKSTSFFFSISLSSILKVGFFIPKKKTENRSFTILGPQSSPFLFSF